MLPAPPPILAATEAAADGHALTPWLVIGLSVAASVATILLLPGRVSVAWRRLGGGLLFAVGFILALVLLLKLGYHNAFFWAFAAIALVGSVRVVTHPQPVYSALYFVLTVFATAGLFVLAYAEFMAVALITIYAGAILITYTFVIMLAADAAPEETGPGGRDDAARRFLAEHDAQARSPVVASIIGFVTAGVLLFAVFDRAPATLDPRLSLLDPAYMGRADAALDEAEREATPETEAELHDRLNDQDILRSSADPAAGGLAAADEALPAGAAAVDRSVIGPTLPLAAETRATRLPAPPALATPARGDLYGYDNRLAYAQEGGRGGVQVLGVYLFTRQLVALQVAGLILTVAMIGAIVIARRRILPQFVAEGRRGVDDGPEDVTMPFTPVNDNPKSLPVVGTGSPRQKAYPQN